MEHEVRSDVPAKSEAEKVLWLVYCGISSSLLEHQQVHYIAVSFTHHVPTIKKNAETMTSLRVQLGFY